MNLAFNLSGFWAPWAFLLLFLAASALMVWRLDTMSRSGFEGTVLGTLVMPYCSGLGNLVFVFVVARQHAAGSEVMVNALVNNITNLTLLLGLPAVLWGLRLLPRKAAAAEVAKGKWRVTRQANQINRLSLLLSLMAGVFFCGATWALARDGRIDFNDGLILTGLFLFWQCFHVFEVMKTNVRERRTLGWTLLLDFSLLAAAAAGVYVSVEWLVGWVSALETGFISAKNLGWLSGWLMVLPNGLLAVYYAWRGRPDITYTSQVGDGHICIPLCIGLSSLLTPIAPPALFQPAMLILIGAAGLHMVVVVVFGGLPRMLGWLLLAAYAIFVFEGLGG